MSGDPASRSCTCESKEDLSMKQRLCVIPRLWMYVFIFLSMTITQGAFAQGQEQRIALQNINLQNGERVETIELSIKEGSFVGFDPLPMGWYLIIDNDPSQQTSIKGDARVGAAALELSELLKLRIRARKVAFENTKFSISGTLVVTKTFTDKRRITLGAENFKFLD